MTSRTSNAAANIRGWRWSSFGPVILVLVLALFILMREERAALRAATEALHEASMASYDKHPRDAALDTALARFADSRLDDARSLRERGRFLLGAQALLVLLGVALLTARFRGKVESTD